MIIYNGNCFLKDDELENLFPGNVELFKKGIKTNDIAESSCFFSPCNENEKLIYVDSLFDSNLLQNTKLNITDNQIYIKGFVLLKVYNPNDFEPKPLGLMKNDLIFTLTLTDSATFNDGEKHLDEPFIIHNSLWDLALLYKHEETLYKEIVKIIRFEEGDIRYYSVERRRLFRLLPEFFDVSHVCGGVIWLHGIKFFPSFMKKLHKIYPDLLDSKKRKTDCIVHPIITKDNNKIEELSLREDMPTLNANHPNESKEESLFSKTVIQNIATRRQTHNIRFLSFAFADYFKKHSNTKTLPSFNGFKSFLISRKDAQDNTYFYDITEDEIILSAEDSLKIPRFKKAYNNLILEIKKSI